MIFVLGGTSDSLAISDWLNGKKASLYPLCRNRLRRNFSETTCRKRILWQIIKRGNAPKMACYKSSPRY